MDAARMNSYGYLSLSLSHTHTHALSFSMPSVSYLLPSSKTDSSLFRISVTHIASPEHLLSSGHDMYWQASP